MTKLLVLHQINASTEMTIAIFGQSEEGLCLQVSSVFKKIIV